jgi:hypothetical protein
LTVKDELQAPDYIEHVEGDNLKDVVKRLFISLSNKYSSYTVNQIQVLITEYIRKIPQDSSVEEKIERMDHFKKSLNIIIGREKHPYKAFIIDLIVFLAVMVPLITIGFTIGMFAFGPVGAGLLGITAAIIALVLNEKVNQKVNSFFFTKSYFFKDDLTINSDSAPESDIGAECDESRMLRS